MELNKEELRKKFHKLFELDDLDWEKIFDFFYQEIEAREKQLTEDSQMYSRNIDKASGKISELQALLLVADEVIDNFGRLVTLIHESVDRSKAKVLLTDSDKIERISNEVSEALEKYQQLKTKQ